MSMQDPIADMLTRIRNSLLVGEAQVCVASSKLKVEIVRVLQQEGYLGNYDVEEINNKPRLKIELKYHQGRPVISRLKRISKPSLRVYRGCEELPQVLGGMGISVISTPKGVMTAHEAQAKRLGGEVLCIVE